MNTYNGNSLYGKKWACCGDSFTAGVTGTLITEGRFKGQNIAYPYLIAERNNMDYSASSRAAGPLHSLPTAPFTTVLQIPKPTAITGIFPKMSTISRSISGSMIPTMSTEKAATERTRQGSSL